MDQTNRDQGRDQEIIQRGKVLFEQIRSAKRSLLPENGFSDFLMDWAMNRPGLKVSLFRFVDVLPNLSSNAQMVRLLREYLLESDSDLPLIYKSGLWLSLSNPLTSSVTAQLVKKNVGAMAKGFIAGENSTQVLKPLRKLWDHGYCFTVDILGEAVLSPQEELHYQAQYRELVNGLGQAVKTWPEQRHSQSASYKIPKCNVSVKLSSLCSQINNLDFKGTVQAIKERVRPILKDALTQEAFVYFDMEQNDFREIVLAVADEILMEAEFRDYPHFGIVIQAYLKDSLTDLRRLKSLAGKRGAPITVRLVKGAYWDYEVAMAQQRDWSIPVFEQKSETDAHYERCTEFLLNSAPELKSAFASHNLRSLLNALLLAEELGQNKSDIEIQMLFGMGGAFQKAFLEQGYRVRQYVPVGELIPGMAYLVRRLLENTANEGFLRSTFDENADIQKLLENPVLKIKSQAKLRPVQNKESLVFKNEAFFDFSIEDQRSWVEPMLKQVQENFPVTVDPVVNGQVKKTKERLSHFNPGQTKQLVSDIACSEKVLADQALEACEEAMQDWATRSMQERAQVLRKAAGVFRERKKELIALITLEVGKPIAEADADVCEAIDFCDYYALLAEQMDEEKDMGSVPGEQNRFFYQAKGPAVAIAPWNFPCAILVGMTVGPLVCGNPVIMKPAEQSSATAQMVFQILKQAGVPDNALHFLPGKGEEVGAYLVAHPKTHIITFTGSRTVGLAIQKQAAQVVPGQHHIKKVVAELGGKNGLIVDDTADIDEAVKGAVSSAFGFAGQKCSACSRVIVDENIYDAFVARFVEAAKAIPTGHVQDLKNKVGPVIDEESYKRLQSVLKKHKDQILAQVDAGDDFKQGFFIPPTVLESSDPKSELGQTEFFGPVVTLFKAKGIDDAIRILN
ncbi:MAG: bifunctional proline dehydrogenase/L-glutamate gamma-semialdehyde dehydrogenase, partial [Deltaproteobacteria bacterium]|nr:bifunctional proline dehydrogenase/L-glutamate gamma-semialdehyde dehydrogenase [Deltaproteobacteria bacterium]